MNLHRYLTRTYTSLILTETSSSPIWFLRKCSLSIVSCCNNYANRGSTWKTLEDNETWYVYKDMVSYQVCVFTSRFFLKSGVSHGLSPEERATKIHARVSFEACSYIVVASTFTSALTGIFRSSEVSIDLDTQCKVKMLTMNGTAKAVCE